MTVETLLGVWTFLKLAAPAVLATAAITAAGGLLLGYFGFIPDFPVQRNRGTDVEVVRLSERDAERLAALLEDPPEPTPRLRQAAERYRSMVRTKPSPDGRE